MLKNDKLSIYLEDQNTKKQWYSGEMAGDDYLTPSNRISEASTMDYLGYFRDSLDSKLDDSSDVQRALEVLEEEVLRLIFDVKIRIFQSARVTKYAFTLAPVSVERIDVLDSKLRDKQHELERLREELERVRGGIDTGYAHIVLKASTKLDMLTLLWDDVKSDNFFVNCETGEVSIRRPGVYCITAVVIVAASDLNLFIKLVKNGNAVQRAYFPSSASDTWTTASSTSRFEAEDVVQVQCRGPIRHAFLSLDYV
ncbi:hypothetical protein PsorP6_015965 [Peronosclerospora sorghi]|uniref:Uncharacterized protein n=1 Tax=Peronosclerospora sorghi TaxID=230839 RepID=A0ACC0WMU7_9STRA|nr:hypothetical protein PsorP6_015965 [Peronosclerospora sorghi]